MFIVANRKIILPSADGRRKHTVERGFIGEIPDWAAETAYFRALVADGKIGVPQSKKDADVGAAAETKPEQQSAPETEPAQPPAEEAAAVPKSPRVKVKAASIPPEA